MHPTNLRRRALDHCNRGREHARGGASEAALAEFAQATTLAPELVDGWYFGGVTLARLGRNGEAAAALQRALALAPQREEIIGALAYAEFRAGHAAAAGPLFERLCRLRPDDVDCHLKLGECLSQLGRAADAAAVFDGALARLPQTPELWLALAQAEDERGERDASERAYARALELKPDWPRPLAGLLAIQRATATNASIERAHVLCADETVDPTGRVLLGHELGKVHDARGEYEQAMACWTAANRLRREQAGALDRAALTARLAELMQRPDPGIGVSDDPRPVLVVGMPRSGTTLVEQVLAAHPAVAGCGEMREISMLGHALPPAARADDALMQREAAAYLAAAERRGGDPAARRLIDKQPLNLFQLDLVARLFANAHVVWCRRDPRDTGLSVFSEHMAPESRFATDLADIGHYHNATVALMRHWQKTLALPILEVDYETLVDDFEPQARRLVEFVGLEWDAACLDFHQSGGAVQTPSRWQVRQPVHRGAVGRWRNYERWLGPLIRSVSAP